MVHFLKKNSTSTPCWLQTIHLLAFPRSCLDLRRSRHFSTPNSSSTSPSDPLASCLDTTDCDKVVGMSFWEEVFAIFVGDVLATAVIALSYGLTQWYLRATDIRIGYAWKWDGPNFHPSFDIRNRSGTQTYRLANIAYTRNDGKEVLYFDNKSIWDKDLVPGSISFLDNMAPVPKIHSVHECIGVEVTVRLQNGRQFWLKGQGPGQLRIGRIQRMAFWLREKIEKVAIPLES